MVLWRDVSESGSSMLDCWESTLSDTSVCKRNNTRYT